MARYDSSLDDIGVEDGDVGFVGVNARLPSWQLGAGMLSLSFDVGRSAARRPR